jgi:hypothetical protein
MFTIVQRVVRHALYLLRGGFLVRPLAMALIIGFIGTVLPFIEERLHLSDSWVARLPVLVVHDVASAQGILAGE